jgi:uncharacterized protein (UPF0332 family)
MNLSDLLEKKAIRKAEPDLLQAKECLKAAERDLEVAKETLEKSHDWALSIAYNSMLLGARALMFADGYRIMGEERHKTAIEYADVKLGAKNRELIALFDRMRSKRHTAVYEKADSISEYEAKFAIKTAEEFLVKIKEKLG